MQIFLSLTSLFIILQFHLRHHSLHIYCCKMYVLKCFLQNYVIFPLKSFWFLCWLGSIQSLTRWKFLIFFQNFWFIDLFLFSRLNAAYLRSASGFLKRKAHALNNQLLTTFPLVLPRSSWWQHLKEKNFEILSRNLHKWQRIQTKVSVSCFLHVQGRR